MEQVRFELNGRPISIGFSPGQTLLGLLREGVGLTGTKSGCEEGECGACTVIVDGRAVASCLLPAAKVEGCRVTTIEGLGGEKLHPVQEAFLRAGAVQCGICIPGMVMAAAALLERNPRPTREEIKAALCGNLCRCTGYAKIVDAVALAAKGIPRGRSRRGRVGMGAPAVRVDAEAKVRGTALYGDDYRLDGLCYLSVVRSPYPSAEVLDIDPEPALAVPGVLGVLTARDIPGVNAYGIIIEDQPVFADTVVRFRGDTVLAVVGESRQAAEEGARRVLMTYRELVPIFSPFDAQKPEAPLLHPSGNLLASLAVRKGDVDAGFRQAAHTVEERFETQLIEHAYIEPEAGVAWREADGTITMAVSTQTPYMDRDATARILGIPPEKIRVIQAVTGGGFGGKLDISIQPYLALAVAKFGRPVKLTLSREESMLSTTKRHPYDIRYRLGAAADGRFVAVQAEITGDTGAYASWGPTVITRACIHATGPYEIPHVLAQGRLWYTNHPPCGAMRGFSTPQLAVATECAIDILAERLGMDPIDLRLRNALRPGSATGTGQVLTASVGMAETLVAVREKWRELEGRRPFPREDGPWAFGIGVASMWYGIGNTSLSNPAEVRVELERDGRVHLYTSATDIGQGSSTILLQILSEALGLDLDRIRITTADTSLTPDSGKTSASRISFIAGNAVVDAARQLQKAVAAEGALLLGVAPDEVIVAGGRVARIGAARKSVGFSRIARRIMEREGQTTFQGYFDPQTTPLDEHGQGNPYQTYAFATQLAQLRVNRRSGEVQVLRVIAAHDLGKAINPQAAEGQIEGGIVMGLGFALMENYIPGETMNFSTYLIPTPLELPEIYPILIETHDPAGPFGAKGVGEPAMIATAPAILNALSRAIGRRITRLPATPERVYRAIHGV